MDPKKEKYLDKLNDLVLNGTELTVDQRTLFNYLLELERSSGIQPPDSTSKKRPKKERSLDKLNGLVLNGTELTVDQRTLFNHLLELERSSGIQPPDSAAASRTSKKQKGTIVGGIESSAVFSALHAIIYCCFSGNSHQGGWKVPGPHWRA